MNIGELIATVVVVTEFIKKAAKSSFGIEIKGKAAVVLAVLVSIGVVFVKAVLTDTPVGLALLPALIQVVLASTMGYSIATKSSSVPR